MVRGATVTARGILDALEGNRDTARELFHVVQGMHFWQAPRSARVYCQAWLLADAAQPRRLSRSRSTFVARTRHVSPRVSARVLAALAGLTEDLVRFRTRALVARGAGASRRALPLEERPRRSPARRHRGDRKRPRLGDGRDRPPGSIAARDGDAGGTLAGGAGLAARSSRATSSPARSWLAATRSKRTSEYRGSRRLSNRTCRPCSPSSFAIPSQKTRPATNRPSSRRAKDALHSELIGELESLAEELPTGNSKKLDGYEHHWRTWAHVRAVAQRYLDTLPERSPAIYDAVGATLRNHGSWLHNHEEAIVLAHDVFRYLLGLVPRKTEDYASLKSNAGIGSSHLTANDVTERNRRARPPSRPDPKPFRRRSS